MNRSALWTTKHQEPIHKSSHNSIVWKQFQIFVCMVTQFISINNLYNFFFCTFMLLDTWICSVDNKRCLINLFTTNRLLRSKGEPTEEILQPKQSICRFVLDVTSLPLRNKGDSFQTRKKPEHPECNFAIGNSQYCYSLNNNSFHKFKNPKNLLVAFQFQQS